MTARDANLDHTGSHHIESAISSQAADGIGKEQVFLYFAATWRGKPVTVTMQADRYAASFFDGDENKSTNRLTDWRVYASEARFIDPDKNGGRGDDVTETARRALSNLCEPLVYPWLASNAYTVSFQAAASRMIMRYFRDDYSASRRVAEVLATFRDRLPDAHFGAIKATLDAYTAYEEVKAATDRLINGDDQ